MVNHRTNHNQHTGHSTKSKHTPKKPTATFFTNPSYIALSVLLIAIVALGISNVYLILNPINHKSESSETGRTTEENTDDLKTTAVTKPVYDKKNYLELTKEEAIEAYQEMHSPGYKPPSYVDSPLASPAGCKPINSLLPSYSHTSDIDEIYESTVTKEQLKKHQTSIVEEYYAVVQSDPFTADTDSSPQCNQMVSFNQKYFDYSNNSPESSASTLGTFVDTSTDFLILSLPVLATTTGYASPVSEVYTHDLEHDAKGTTLNIYTLSVGYNIDYTDTKAYKDLIDSKATPDALEFGIRKFRFDNATKQADWVKECEGCIDSTKITKIIPLTPVEVYELMHPQQ